MIKQIKINFGIMSVVATLIILLGLIEISTGSVFKGFLIIFGGLLLYGTTIDFSISINEEFK